MPKIAKKPKALRRHDEREEEDGWPVAERSSRVTLALEAAPQHRCRRCIGIFFFF